MTKTTLHTIKTKGKNALEWLIAKVLNLGKKRLKYIKDDFNILVVGKTGVGKSTLINTILGKEVAKTGSGVPITQGIPKYKINKVGIFDTQGLELKDYASIKRQIERFLDERRGKALCEQIHLAWLCIAETSRRIEDGDIEMQKLLKRHNIPTIFVITKATQDIDENGEKFSQIVREKFDIKNERHIQRVVALAVKDDEGNESKVRGIKELEHKSCKMLEKAQTSIISNLIYHAKSSVAFLRGLFSSENLKEFLHKLKAGKERYAKGILAKKVLIICACVLAVSFGVVVISEFIERQQMKIIAVGVLAVLFVACVVAIFVINAKLKAGKAKLQSGWRKYRENDKWYARLLFRDKLEQGLRDLNAGEAKYAKWLLIKKVLIVCALLLVVGFGVGLFWDLNF